MPSLSPPRAALGAITPALLAGVVSGNPLLAFYLTALSAAGLVGSAFLAYLEAVDDSRPRRVAELLAIALAAVLVMLQAAISFPATLGGEPAGGPGALLIIAFLLLLATVFFERLPGRRLLERIDLTPLRQLLTRS